MLLAGFCLWRAGFHAKDREQWHANITHFSEQAIQRGLIGYRAGEQRLAVAFQRDGEAVEPAFPLLAQVALDSDLIDQWLSLFDFCIDFV
jgi:hypothetical protein